VSSAEDLERVDDPLELFKLASGAITHHQAEIDRLAEIRMRSLAALAAGGSSYRELAKTLGMSAPRVSQLVSANESALIEVLKAWAALEKTMIEIARAAGELRDERESYYPAVRRILSDSAHASQAVLDDLDEFRQARNAIAHGRLNIAEDEANRFVDKAIYLNAILTLVLNEIKTGDHIQNQRHRTAGTATGPAVVVQPANHNQMRRALIEFVDLVKQYQSSSFLSAGRRDAIAGLRSRKATVRQILRSIGPDLDISSGQSGADFERAVASVQRAIRLLDAWDSWETDPATSRLLIPGGNLYPLVWHEAQESWNAGLYRQAVHAGGIAVNDMIQARIGRRDISDVPLMEEAFNPDRPHQYQRRLRCPGDHSDMSVRAQQEGALHYAVGCFKVMWTPASRLTGSWNPLIGFEYLTALSVVARWGDCWEVVTGLPPATGLNIPVTPASGDPRKPAK
jgi:transcriptional regulator with XRE-family HTH domain